MRRSSLGACAFALVVSGCTGTGAFRPDPNNDDPLYGVIPIVKAPLKNRCEAQGSAAARASCEDALYLATEYTRRLSVGDEVCMEGGYGEEPGAACKARAAIIDTSPNQVKLEVRGPKPDSRWFNVEMRHAWYEEGALVDLYLSERGY